MWTYFLLASAVPCNQTNVVIKGWLTGVCRTEKFFFETDSPCSYLSTRPIDAYTLRAPNRLEAITAKPGQPIIGVKAQCITKSLQHSMLDRQGSAPGQALPDGFPSLHEPGETDQGLPDIGFVVVIAAGALALFILVPTILLLSQRKG